MKTLKTMNNNGFSIVELVVATAIAAIISAIVFIGYKDMGKQNFLENQANILISGIERARSGAVSALELKDLDNQQVSVFSITFYQDRFVIFENTEEERIKYYENGVIMTNNENIGSSIGFSPPDPAVFFIDNNEEYISGDYHEIILNYSDNLGDEIKIRVNRVGLVEFIKE